jgi:hypothetical protein
MSTPRDDRPADDDTESTDLAEIYQTPDPLEADVIQDEILGPNDIESRILDRTSHPFNTPTMAGALYIAVPRAQAERARALVREARENQLISQSGDFVEAR